MCAQRRKLLRTSLLLKAHEDLKMEIQNMFTHIFHTRVRYVVLLYVINLQFQQRVEMSSILCRHMSHHFYSIESGCKHTFLVADNLLRWTTFLFWQNNSRPKTKPNIQVTLCKVVGSICYNACTSCVRNFSILN